MCIQERFCYAPDATPASKSSPKTSKTGIRILRLAAAAGDGGCIAA